jgi:hypothetical protein
MRMPKPLLIIIILFGLFQYGCEPERNPQLELYGETAWFETFKAKVDSQYLLSNYTQSFESKNIDWPPRELRRTVDISLDVTGSCYWTHIQYNGEVIPLAKYNLLRFCEMLKFDKVIHSGDRVILRLYGSKYGIKGADTRESIEIEIPPMHLYTKGTILTKKHDDLQFYVKNVTIDTIQIYSAIDSIKQWLLPFVISAQQPSDQYKESLLLGHIDHVVHEYPVSNEISRIFYFITDGWFQVDGTDFNPSTYLADKLIIEKIKSYVVQSKLKPFFEKQRTTCVVFYGLNSGGNVEFQRVQEKLLNWYLSPQNITLIYY